MGSQLLVHVTAIHLLMFHSLRNGRSSLTFGESRLRFNQNWVHTDSPRFGESPNFHHYKVGNNSVGNFGKNWSSIRNSSVVDYTKFQIRRRLHSYIGFHVGCDDDGGERK